LLATPLALLSTVAAFLGVWWGGFSSYIHTYTGAVALGAALGLLFVVCLLSYLENQRTLWLVAAGGATGVAFLTKAEFALACAGTGLFFLTQLIVFPKSFSRRRGPGIRALGVYIVSAAIPVGIGYGLLAHQAGWQHLRAGISGYDLPGVVTGAIPPWGTSWSWSHIISGLGMGMLVVVALIGILAPALVRRRMSWAGALLVLCLALILLPWGLQFLLVPGRLAHILSLSELAKVGIIMQVVLAPGTLVLTVLIIALGIRWSRAYRRGATIRRVEQLYAVLVVYSALVGVRFYFNPSPNIAYGWLPQYINTLFPVFAFSLTDLVPRFLECQGQTRLQRLHAQRFVVLILFAFAVIGLALDMKVLALMNYEIETLRGTVLMNATHASNRAGAEMLQYITSHTEPGDSIVVLGTDPGLYYLSQRKNPLRQDYILTGLGSSSADAREIVERLKTHPPALVIIPRQIEKDGAMSGYGLALEVRQRYYETLAPVWRHVHSNYRADTVVGGMEWGYTVYEPQPPLE
jgi:hypothetical protein